MARMAQAVAWYRGEFLAGFTLPGSTGFEEWRLFQQEALHVRMLDALTLLSAYHFQRREYDQAIPYLQRQIELEAWREEAHRLLMQVLAAQGQRNAALAQFETCRRTLTEQLGVEPEAATVALAEQIRSGDFDKVTRRQGEGVTR
jgi:DNA-binding SARP family transcriptional activator